MDNRGIDIFPPAEGMMNSEDFVTLGKPENINLIRLQPEDMGLKGKLTINKINVRAKALGLDLCPAEVGPHYRLSHTNELMNRWEYIGMKPIAYSYGNPNVFMLARDWGGVRLDGCEASSLVGVGGRGNWFVFSLGK